MLIVLTGVLGTTDVSAAKKAKWKESKGYSYYYNKSGKKVTGKVTIGKRTYLFNEKGAMQTGWKRYKGKYYFFHLNKGFMLKDKKVNGIRLTKKGAAKITKDNKSLVKTFTRASEIYDEITKPTMTRKEKLKKCFDFVVKYPYATRRKWSNFDGWYIAYANDMFEYGRGNCFSYAAAFGFLANACGYEDVYIISSGGHGWAEVKGLVFDPEEHKAGHGNMFGRDYSTMSRGYNICRRTYYKKLS